MSGLVLVEQLERGIVSVTLNRPDRRNALSIDLLEQLCAEIERLSSDDTHRVVILRGAGPVFSAGLDLREAADSSLVERSAAAVSRALDLLRKPAGRDCRGAGRSIRGRRGVDGCLRHCDRRGRRADRISRSAPWAAAGTHLRRADAQGPRRRSPRVVPRRRADRRELVPSRSVWCSAWCRLNGCWTRR